MFFKLISNCKFQISNSQVAFTIIELLIVIAIITILPVIVIANFPQVKLQFALSRTTYTFTQDVRQAQDMALSSLPHKDSFGIVQPVGGYGIYVDIDGLGNKKYLLYADRLPTNSRYDAGDYVVKVINIETSEPGVIIKSLGDVFLNKASIHFAADSGAVSINQLDPPSPKALAGQSKNTNDVQVIFALEDNTAKTKSVFVSTAGLVEIK